MTYKSVWQHDHINAFSIIKCLSTLFLWLKSINQYRSITRIDCCLASNNVENVFTGLMQGIDYDSHQKRKWFLLTYSGKIDGICEHEHWICHFQLNHEMLSFVIHLNYYLIYWLVGQTKISDYCHNNSMKFVKNLFSLMCFLCDFIAKQWKVSARF